MTALLPPEIEAHPDLECDCPHCGEELALNMREVYALATQHTSGVDTPERRADQLRLARGRVACPECRKPFDYHLRPITTWAVDVGLPDPAAIAFPDGSLLGGRRGVIRPDRPTALSFAGEAK